MMELGEYFYGDCKPFAPPIVKPNRITGEGRMKYRPWSCRKQGDQKKKVHRKMAKQSRRKNRK